MTDTEKTEIINAIIAHLKANSATISQLTNINSLTNRDYFEVAGGKRISYISLRDALKEYISPLILADFRNAISGKQNAEEGKGLSTNDYTDADKAKLEGIDDGANDYVHPATHSAEMITETDEKLFFTPAERQKLQGLENVPADWVGTQSEYNALTAKDAGRWYFITDGDEVVAVYRGATLIHATANLVGQFADDSVPEDWYWWPNGIKTALPVDPATGRFAAYYPGIVDGNIRFYDPASPKNSRLVSIERIPYCSQKLDLDYLPECKIYPVLDFEWKTESSYMLIGRSNAPARLAFKDTGQITTLEMMLNIQKGQLKILTGFDCAALYNTSGQPFSVNGAAYMPLTNIGKAQAAATLDLRNKNWGDDTIVAGARQTLVDSLLTYSYDRVAAGYGTTTLRLSPQAFARLTAEEVAAITAKGYTISAE